MRPVHPAWLAAVLTAALAACDSPPLTAPAAQSTRLCAVDRMLGRPGPDPLPHDKVAALATSETVVEVIVEVIVEPEEVRAPAERPRAQRARVPSAAAGPGAGAAPSACQVGGAASRQ